MLCGKDGYNFYDSISNISWLLTRLLVIIMYVTLSCCRTVSLYPLGHDPLYALVVQIDGDDQA